jgi:glucose/arabinose dehydrogenase
VKPRVRQAQPIRRIAILALMSSMALGISACPRSTLAQLADGEPAAGFELGTWRSDLPEVTDIAFLSDGRAVVTLKAGKAVLLAPSGDVLQPSALVIKVDSASEKGLLGVVVDDDDNLYFYVSDGSDIKDKHHVYKGRLDATGKVDLDTSKSIIGNGLEGPANHDGGGMVIHKGQLYVGVGDTGNNHTPPTNRYGTCLNKANGKILRVGLDGSIPGDNPLVNEAMVTGCEDRNAAFGMFAPDKRIYAWGLRNPWRIFIDPKTDLLWIGDVGEVTEEEITVGGKGVHHGWPFFEGTTKYDGFDGVSDCSQITPARKCLAPQHSYPRSDGISVTGGLIPPAQCGWGAYEGRYFFADYGSARIWTLDLRPDRSGAVPNSRREFAMVQAAVSFRMGKDGAMYVASHDTGSLIRIAPRAVPASCNTAVAISPQPDSGIGTTPAAADHGDDGGCGCRSVSGRSPGALVTIVLGLLLAVSVRRRGRRDRPG